MSEEHLEPWGRPAASVYQETAGPITWSASTYGGRFKSAWHDSAQAAVLEAQLLATEAALNVTRAQRDKFSGRIAELEGERDERQGAIDKALSALSSSAYVGGPSEREAWQIVSDALGSFRTEHVGQDPTSGGSNDG